MAFGLPPMNRSKKETIPLLKLSKERNEILFSVRFEDVNVTNIFILAEAEACGNETNESLDAKANSALECPYIADLRRGATNAPI
ncbi:lysosomal cystine transporter family protein [Cucumis melo var. makuwa]|uniref:Lysosomal cystine transporter family protein n=1 Tax=Cucumis melo var. makuwa TaxID=1194695 RepID=A0A5A7TI46_CUCMM|nr:lysosomal cystine transporter family protein [Cucumis melo var. makuwa]